MSWGIGVLFSAMILLLGSAFKDLISRQIKSAGSRTTIRGFTPDPTDIEVAEKMESFGRNQGVAVMSWIRELTPRNWHYLVLSWNYDGPFDNVLAWILGHPDCDKGTAQAVLYVNLIEIAEYKFDETDQDILFFLKLSRDACKRLYNDAYVTSNYLPYRKGMEDDYLRTLEISEGHYLRDPGHYSLEFKKSYYLPL